jgi:signal transduction histidine kinase/ActR/RegA family two-component response regulator
MFQEMVDSLKSGIAVYTYVSASDDFFIKDFAIKNHDVSSYDYSTADHVIGRKVYELYPAMKNSCGDAMLRSVLADGIPRDCYFAVKNDGKDECFYKNFVYRVTPCELVITFDNITRHVRTEESLKTAETRYWGIVENLPLLICHFLPAKWKITYANPEFCKYYDLADAAIPGMDFMMMMPEVERTKILAHCSALSPEKPVETFEFSAGSAECTKILCWTFQAIFSKDGKIREFHGMGQDITEARSSAEKLSKAMKKAEESDRLKTAFLHNISHEIRTPLNGIMGFADLLNGPEITEMQRQNYAKIIIDSSNRLLAIFNDLLSISTLQTKQEKVNESNVQLNKMLLDILTFFNPAAAKKNIDLSFSKRLPDAQAEIYTDESKLQHILKNILSNALKFTSCGTIEFGYSLKNDSLEFFVKDTGIGIDEKFHSRIFGEFCHADTSVGRKYGGTGLGLSISKGYVELLGGKIWIKSTPDVGSVFYFTIPFKPLKSISDNEYLRYEILDRLDGAKILIAEDEELCYFYLKELFRTFCPILLHASNGNEAVEICRNNPDIVLVLMDLKMPGMDGFKAVEEIKKFRPQLPVIAETAYACQTDIEKAFASGCDEYITKPVKRSILMEKIVTLLNKADAQAQLMSS